MLETVLALVAEGGIHSYEALAKRLSIPSSLLEVMLADLARLGYLRAVDDGCAGHCGGCPAGPCSIAGSGRLWTLTEKGARAAARCSA
jgi:DNA-binding IscR family transcriptional regulator